MNQRDLMRKMKEKGLGDIHFQHIAENLREGKSMTPTYARRFEIALDIPKYTLVKMSGYELTPSLLKKLEQIGGNQGLQ